MAKLYPIKIREANKFTNIIAKNIYERKRVLVRVQFYGEYADGKIEYLNHHQDILSTDYNNIFWDMYEEGRLGEESIFLKVIKDKIKNKKFKYHYKEVFVRPEDVYE
ncbi:MAG: hypothetical protein ACOCQD_01570 [archaeon]